MHSIHWIMHNGIFSKFIKKMHHGALNCASSGESAPPLWNISRTHLRPWQMTRNILLRNIGSRPNSSLASLYWRWIFWNIGNILRKNIYRPKSRLASLAERWMPETIFSFRFACLWAIVIFAKCCHIAIWLSLPFCHIAILLIPDKSSFLWNVNNLGCRVGVGGAIERDFNSQILRGVLHLGLCWQVPADIEDIPENNLHTCRQ